MATASDFYGATVIDKDAPSSYMKYSIYGQRSIISDILENSPASKAGFKCGDIILAVNDKVVKRSSEMNNFTENTLAVQVFDGSEWKTITLDRLAIETEKSRQLAVGKKPAIVAAPLHKRTYTVTKRPDNSPPLKFDNAYLEKRFGTVLSKQATRTLSRGTAATHGTPVMLSSKTASVSYSRHPSVQYTGYGPIAQNSTSNADIRSRTSPSASILGPGHEGEIIPNMGTGELDINLGNGIILDSKTGHADIHMDLGNGLLLNTATGGMKMIIP